MAKRDNYQQRAVSPEVIDGWPRHERDLRDGRNVVSARYTDSASCRDALIEGWTSWTGACGRASSNAERAYSFWDSPIPCRPWDHSGAGSGFALPVHPHRLFVEVR